MRRDSRHKSAELAAVLWSMLPHDTCEQVQAHLAVRITGTPMRSAEKSSNCHSELQARTERRSMKKRLTAIAEAILRRVIRIRRLELTN